jgi:hypothetical protein
MMNVSGYPIPIEDSFDIQLPRDARILAIHEQLGQPKVWAIVDEDQPMKRRRFHVVGNNVDLSFDPGACDYVGSFQAAGDVLVFHVFVEPDDRP